MTEAQTTETPRPRAAPLALDERKAMIVDAVIPLLLEHGRALTSRQIAEAAGVAEGTVFRAFGDKESLVEAAIRKHLDPEPVREALRSIDPSLPLEHKVRAILYLLRERFRSVMRIMPVIGGERPPIPQERAEFARIIAEVLRPEADALNWPPERVAHILRLVSFSSAFPALNDGQEFSIDDLARIVLTGIAGELPAGFAAPLVPAGRRPAGHSASEEDPCS
ncbi:TetR/AcrR family transcriptional regulator [Leifsonia sp. AG29]|uniref:TetR/AcrR family transcriptional regulator n=1 Tax=Leifsonia sp. AG29 TaxID=2598860 RepID=UPI001E433E90|nr:TetR/AcrR family transcriptional regulator [Leifsonia sp. AG29]